MFLTQLEMHHRSTTVAAVALIARTCMMNVYSIDGRLYCRRCGQQTGTTCTVDGFVDRTLGRAACCGEMFLSPQSCACKNWSRKPHHVVARRPTSHLGVICHLYASTCDSWLTPPPPLNPPLAIYVRLTALACHVVLVYVTQTLNR